MDSGTLDRQHIASILLPGGNHTARGRCADILTVAVSCNSAAHDSVVALNGTTSFPTVTVLEGKSIFAPAFPQKLAPNMGSDPTPPTRVGIL